MGRAARNVNGHVILYANKITRSIQAAVDETNRRRTKQEHFNAERGIIPKTIIKPIGNSFDLPVSKSSGTGPSNRHRSRHGDEPQQIVGIGRKSQQLAQLQKLMERAIRRLEYDQALLIREQIQKLKHAE